MAVAEMYDFTREFYKIPVVLRVDGVAIDPTALTVEFAIVAQGTRPGAGDWITGDWETDPNGVWLARILVGDATAAADGGFQIIQPAIYDVFFRITDAPERPARLVGQIKAK